MDKEKIKLVAEAFIVLGERIRRMRKSAKTAEGISLLTQLNEFQGDLFDQLAADLERVDDKTN